MKKYTEGSWKFLKNVGRPIIVAADGTRICNMLSGLWTGHVEANGRLIAAVPELLEACKYALPLLKHQLRFFKYQSAGRYFWPNREEAERTIDDLIKAIAKAEVE